MLAQTFQRSRRYEATYVCTEGERRERDKSRGEENNPHKDIALHHRFFLANNFTNHS